MANLRIQTHHLKKGMMIAADVYTHAGVIIVPKDTVVTKDVVDLLTRHFVDDVIIDYEPKKKDTWQLQKGRKTSKKNSNKSEKFVQAFHVAEESLSQNLKEIVQQDKEVDIQALLELIQTVVNKAENETELCTMLHCMKCSSEALYAHSIHVALYAQLLARWAELPPEETELVMLAGLLHDIGHLNYSETAQNGFCLHEELEKRCQEKHSLYGYKLLQNKTVNYRIKQAVLTHHECMDGSGFPMGVAFENINDISRVLSIADTYATLSMEEPGYPVMSPFEILKYMQSQEFSRFDSRYLLTFMEHIAQNFIQHEVLLSNGKKGTIVMLNKLDLTRPLVQMEDRFVDLTVHKDLEIKEIYAEI